MKSVVYFDGKLAEAKKEKTKIAIKTKMERIPLFCEECDCSYKTPNGRMFCRAFIPTQTLLHNTSFSKCKPLANCPLIDLEEVE